MEHSLLPSVEHYNGTAAARGASEQVFDRVRAEVDRALAGAPYDTEYRMVWPDERALDRGARAPAN